MSAVWVYAEVGPEGPATSALELLTRARTLADIVAAVALGPGATQAAAALGAHGASTVFASDDPIYAEAVARPAAHALAELVGRHAPDLILFSSSHEARDVAGRLQARTGSTLMGNATDVSGIDRAVTQIFGDSRFVEVALDGPQPKLVLVRPKSFAPEASGGTAEVVPVDVDIPDELRGARLLKVTRALAQQHYAEHKGKPFFGELAEFITGGDLVAMVLEGPNAINAARQLIGATDPVEADAGSIRGQFGTEVTFNLVHGSDSENTAEREIGLWFPELGD